MGMFHSINVSSTGLSAQKARLDVISNNIANVNTTRTTEGGPFRRSLVVLRTKEERMTYKSPFLPTGMGPRLGEGVKVAKIEKDAAPGRMVYDPTHPDAYKYGPKKGYVEMPNVNVVKEMVDMIEASRAYEANVTLLNTSKTMFQKSIGIGLK
jgi:flagellar basal-body rod protein FlgC